MSTPCCHFPHNRRSHNRNLICHFPAGLLEAQKNNLAKNEGENPGLILLLILAADRQRLVRRLNDFHGRSAIYIRPKSMSRKQIKATLSRSSVTFGGEAAGEMESGAWKTEEAGVKRQLIVALRH